MAAASFGYRAKQDSSSDSDSDNSDRECSDWKRATRKQQNSLERIPIDPPPAEPSVNTTLEDKSAVTRNGSDPSASKRKRNNIWSEVLEDQILSESLNHCGVKQKPKDYGSRGEESYDYTLARKYYKKEEVSEGDMSEGDMSDATETSSVTSSVKERRFHNRRPFVKLDGASADAAKRIVKILGEQKPYLIFRVVKLVGIEKAMELLKKTEEVEESGGMMIKNNARRRTPGGVYFQLLKSDPAVSKSVVEQVFEGEMNSFEAKRLIEERRKKKKKFAAKRKAEKAALKASELPLPLTFPKPEMKQEETAIKMEDDSMVVEELPNELSFNNNDQETKDLDLEDGEIDD